MTTAAPGGGGWLRQHVTATAVVATVLVAALLVVLLTRSGEAEPTPEPSPAPSTGPAQETLQVILTLGRTKLVSMVIGVGGQPDRTVLLDVPQDLLVVDGPTYTPLLDANLSLSRRLPVLATQNTLGVRLDSGWRMERKALAGFVDGVGGVTVDVAAPLTVLDDTGAVVLAPTPGPATLSGPAASWYVMGTVPGEADPVGGAQARFRQVFLAAVAELPDDAGTVAALLTRLGALSDPLNGTASMASTLLRIRDGIAEGPVAEPILTLRAATAGDPVVTREQPQRGPAAAAGSFRVLDFAASTPMLREQFLQSPRLAGVDGAPRVLVTDATGDPRTVWVALEELTDAGFVAMSAGTAGGPQPVTGIVGRGFSANGLSYAAGAAEALRLTDPQFGGDSASRTPSPPDLAAAPAVMPPAGAVPLGDVDVVLGADYRPCPPEEPACLDDILEVASP
jgi:hypothetical protein